MTTWNQLLHPENDTNLFDRVPLPAFLPDANEYRPENAYWLAELSRIVYRDLAFQPSDPIVNDYPWGMTNHSVAGSASVAVGGDSDNLFCVIDPVENAVITHPDSPSVI